MPWVLAAGPPDRRLHARGPQRRMPGLRLSPSHTLITKDPSNGALPLASGGLQAPGGPTPERETQHLPMSWHRPTQSAGGRTHRQGPRHLPEKKTSAMAPSPATTYRSSQCSFTGKQKYIPLLWELGRHGGRFAQRLTLSSAQALAQTHLKSEDRGGSKLCGQRHSIKASVPSRRPASPASRESTRAAGRGGARHPQLEPQSFPTARRALPWPWVPATRSRSASCPPSPGPITNAV